MLEQSYITCIDGSYYRSQRRALRDVERSHHSFYGVQQNVCGGIRSDYAFNFVDGIANSLIECVVVRLGTNWKDSFVTSQHIRT